MVPEALSCLDVLPSRRRRWCGCRRPPDTHHTHPLTTSLGAIGFGAAGPIASRFPPATICDVAIDSSELSGRSQLVRKVTVTSLLEVFSQLPRVWPWVQHFPPLYTSAGAGITRVMVAAVASFGSNFLVIGVATVSTVVTGIGATANLLDPES